MEKRIAEMLGNGVTVTRNKVVKNNGVVLDAFVIRKGDSKVGANVYFDPTLSEDVIVQRVCATYQQNMSNIGGVEDMLSGLNRDVVLKNVRPVLINTESNASLLSDAVYLPYLDMSVVYRVFISDVGSFVVTRALVDALNISGSELYEAAMSNLAQMFVIRKMSELGSFPTMCDEFMLVVNTKDSMYGASVMALPGLLEQIGKVFDSDYYIIPSSIHEIICVPANLEVDPGIIVDMIKVVNIEAVAPDDVLSNSLYKWSKKKGVEVVR